MQYCIIYLWQGLLGCSVDSAPWQVVVNSPDHGGQGGQTGGQDGEIGGQGGQTASHMGSSTGQETNPEVETPFGA